MLTIPPETFGIVDLESDSSLGERFDVVQPLKVAVHLSHGQAHFGRKLIDVFRVPEVVFDTPTARARDPRIKQRQRMQ